MASSLCIQNSITENTVCPEILTSKWINRPEITNDLQQNLKLNHQLKKCLVLMLLTAFMNSTVTVKTATACKFFKEVTK